MPTNFHPLGTLFQIYTRSFNHFITAKTLLLSSKLYVNHLTILALCYVKSAWTTSVEITWSKNNARLKIKLAITKCRTAGNFIYIYRKWCTCTCHIFFVKLVQSLALQTPGRENHENLGHPKDPQWASINTGKSTLASTLVSHKCPRCLLSSFSIKHTK